MRKSLARIALVLVLALAFGMIAGCDKTEPTTVTTTAATTAGTTTVATTAGTTGKFPNLNPPGQLPVVKEKETLRLVISQSPHIMSYAYGENKLTTWLQDRTNVEIEFILYPEADAAAKLNIELSTAGDLGDVVRVTNPLSKPALMTFGSQGAIMDVTDLINEYGYNFKADLDKKAGSWEANTAPDGAIYALPQGPAAWLVTNSTAMRHWIKTDFLNKYTAATGKGMPGTTDEYFAYMVWCRDNIPGSIGWSGSEKRTVWYARPTDFLMHAFTWNSKDGYYEVDDKIHANFVEPDYREGLKFLNKMMEEGLMDENYADNDENQLKTLVAMNNGNTVASGSWGGMHNAATDNKIKNSYQIVPPLKGPKGFQNAFYNISDYLAKPGPVIIPSNSAKPELAMAWFDSCYDIEVSFRQRYGEKGVDWEVPPPTELAVDGGPGIYRDLTNQWNVPTYSHWFTSGPSLYRPYFMAVPQPKTDKNGNEIHDLEKSLYDATVLFEKYIKPCTIPDFYFDEATSIKANEIYQLVDSRSRATITEFIYGTKDINDDAVWAAYVADLKASGLDDYLKIMQTEYDRSWKGALPNTYTPFPQRTK